MLYNGSFKLACLFLFVFLLTLPVSAVSEEVRMSADSLVFDQETGELKAEGDVEMQRGDMTLRADQAIWDENSGDVYCEGSVRMTTPDGRATGDSLQYNFDSGRGRIVNGRIELPGLAYLSGAEIATEGDENYTITDGYFTSCSGDTPSWSFGASELEVRLGQFAQAKHAKFYLSDIPVMYLPYLAFPAKTERSSGFLMPTLGFSSRLGTRVEVPWFQVIDVDQDATLTIDYMSRMGVGTGLEYRYFKSTVRPARLYGNYVTGTDGESDRYLLEWHHDGFLPGETRLAINAQYVNSNDYFELFGGSAQEYTSDKVQSDLYVSKVWTKTNLSGMARYTRALQQDTSTVLQTLPAINLTIVPQRFFETPLMTSFEVDATNFWRHVGETGTRLRLYPAISTDFFSTRFLNLLPTVAWREQLYRVGGSTERAGRPEASVTLGNRFARIFQHDKEGGASRHSFELRMSYLYAPEVDTASIPQFDFRDEFSAINRFSVNLDNRWTVRQFAADGSSSYRDLAKLRLLVDYDLEEQRRTLGPPPDSHHPFSPLTIELEVRPLERIYLQGDIDLLIEDNPGQMDALAIWGGFNDKVGNGLLINYSYSRMEFEYFSAHVDLALLAPVYANYEGRFDLRGQQNLDYRTSLEYRSACWSVAAHWYERPGDRGVSFSFSLSNITGKNLKSVTTPLNNWF